jgi:hypothetical protein
MSQYDEVLADLKTEFGKKILLSPSDIAPYINRSVDAQSALRNRKTFPIPYGKMGGKITIKIYDLARYIANDDVVAVATAMPTKSVVRLQQPKEKSHRGFSLGKSLISFARTIERAELQIEFMKCLYIAIAKIDLEKTMPKGLPNRHWKPL